ncbi:MAG: hypothetical protein J7L98_00290 [Candidatus Verstraetearchaeota archaeon]|nr:hypothetical protein [Candidatus Verstraetearchaeota archaeon]
MPIHKECAFYSDGVCLLHGVRVDPEGQACPHFKPREETVAATTQQLLSRERLVRPMPPRWRRGRRRRFRRYGSQWW